MTLPTAGGRSTSSATLLGTDDDPALPVGHRTLAAASGAQEPFFEDATVEGTHVRVLTTPLAEGIALQLARPLDEVDDVLADLRLILAFVSLGGIVLAAGLGLVVSRTALSPVRRLTRTAEHIARTQDLSQRIETAGRDEVSRLGATFNTMLGALEESQRAQQQLVLDASHELRTPLTSLRTNIELLAREDDIGKEEQEEMLGDVTAQLEELTTLVADVVELARGNEPDATAEIVGLDALVTEAVERASRHSPQVQFVTDLDGSTVMGVHTQLDRAGREPARQRCQVEPGRRNGRGELGGRRDHGTRSWPWHPPRRPPPRLRSLLSVARCPQVARLGPGPGDRPQGC